jgi:hypothetical protein
MQIGTGFKKSLFGHHGSGNETVWIFQMEISRSGKKVPDHGLIFFRREGAGAVNEGPSSF